MTLNRREFLRAFGASAVAWLLPSGVVLAAQTEVAAGHRSDGMLVDLARCIGCGWCYEACKQWHALPPEPFSSLDGSENQPSLSATNWTVVQSKQIQLATGPYSVFVKRQCMHCLNPACASACPVGAMQAKGDGAVLYDAERCIGCRYCMVACPFKVPKFEWEQPLPTIQKCTFCEDRRAAGQQPACSEACRTGALLFGERDALVAEAEARIEAAPEQYVDHVYGKEEFGGTSWLYVSPVPFAGLGFPNAGAEPVTRLSEAVATFGTPGAALSVALLLGGAYHWFTHLEGSRPAEEPVRQEQRGEKS
jgi:formate dehydrogenase iron-sulfur subunit